MLREEVERIKQQLDVLSCLSSLSALACLVDLPLVSTSGYTHNSQEEPRNFPPIAIKHPLQLHPHQQQQLQQQQHTLPPPMRRSIHLGSTRIPDSQTPSLPDSVPLLSSHYPHIDVQREIIDLDREYAKALVIKERLARELTAQTMAQWHGTTHEPEPAEAQDAVSRLPQPPAPSEQELGPRSQTIAVPLDKVPVPSSSSSPGEELIGALLLGDSRHRLPQDASRVKEWEMRERVPVLKAFRHDALRQSLS